LTGNHQPDRLIAEKNLKASACSNLGGLPGLAPCTTGEVVVVFNFEAEQPHL
jgi:hypothetical protein